MNFSTSSNFVGAQTTNYSALGRTSDMFWLNKRGPNHKFYATMSTASGFHLKKTRRSNSDASIVQVTEPNDEPRAVNGLEKWTAEKIGALLLRQRLTRRTT